MPPMQTMQSGMVPQPGMFTPHVAPFGAPAGSPGAAAGMMPGAMVDPSAASGEMPLVYAAADGEGDSGGAGGSGSGGTSKTSARALLAQHKVQIPDDLTKLQPIPTRRTKSGWVGVYPARKGRWQAQVNHRSIGGYATAWEAGVAVAAHLVVMARAEEQAEIARAEGREVAPEVVPEVDAIVSGAVAHSAAVAAAGKCMPIVDVEAVVAVDGADADSAAPLAIATAVVATAGEPPRYRSWRRWQHR